MRLFPLHFCTCAGPLTCFEYRPVVTKSSTIDGSTRSWLLVRMILTSAARYVCHCIRIKLRELKLSSLPQLLDIR